MFIRTVGGADWGASRNAYTQMLRPGYPFIVLVGTGRSGFVRLGHADSGGELILAECAPERTDILSDCGPQKRMGRFLRFIFSGRDLTVYPPKPPDPSSGGPAAFKTKIMILKSSPYGPSYRMN